MRTNKRRTPMYVDVDNLYIINNKVNQHTLMHRVNHILTTFSGSHDIYFFGNSFTQNVLSKYGILMNNFYVSDIEANSADHNMIDSIFKTKDKNVTIITGDMTLCRIALYIHRSKNISFLKFDESHDLHSLEVDFKFARREQLDKFIKSFALYSVRYT